MFFFVIAIVIGVILRWVWKLLNWAWLKPRKVDKWLRDVGYKGNSYKFVIGDLKEMSRMMQESKSKSMAISHDITSHVLPFDHHIINKYGKKSFMWFGPAPRIHVMDPELIKDILSRPNEFEKTHPEPLRDCIVGGLLVSEGHKWIKHRQIINPAFHLDNITSMFSAICLSCSDMINKWELLMVDKSSTMEVDVWPFIEYLAGDVISRTAFGSSFKEGQKIFLIQKEQMELATQQLLMLYLPGGRFIPTRVSKKFKENEYELRALIRGIIDKRKKAIEMGENRCEDLLGILLESNAKEIKEDGVGMSMEDVIEECKLFYVAGSETTSNLIVWAMVCLSLHQEWQIKARQEIMQVFGTGELLFEGVKQLKIVTMILNEVLRLYPPGVMIHYKLKAN